LRATRVKPSDIRPIAELALIPTSTRRDLQQAEATDLVACGLDPARLLTYRTSGSTGEPLTVRRPWLEERVNSAFRVRTFRDFGVRARDARVVFLAGGGVLTAQGRNRTAFSAC
jgi:phenylacetate-coenzyme A ligase PaaK-like adenylate-forming protein